MDESSRVALPDAIAAPLEVYVNGVKQERGTDYELRGRELVFNRSLAQEGRLGFIRWLSIFLGFAAPTAGTTRSTSSTRPAAGDSWRAAWRRSAQRQELVRGADRQAGRRPARDDVDAAVRVRDAEAVARRR